MNHQQDLSSGRRLYQRLYPGINTRITVPFLVAIVIVAGIGAFVVTRLVAGSIQERLNNQLVDSARAASNTVAEIEQYQLATLRLMTFTEGMDEAIVNANASRIDTLLRPIAANAEIDDLIIFDETGQGILRLQRLDNLDSVQYTALVPDSDIQNRPGIQHVLASEADAVGDKYLDMVEEGAFTLLYISAPVRDADGKLVGGVSVGITTTHFARRVSEQSLSAVILYNEHGRVLGTTLRSVHAGELPLTLSQAQSLFVAAQKEDKPVEERTFGDQHYQMLYAPLWLRGEQVGLIAVALRRDFVADKIGTSRNFFVMLFAGLFMGVAILEVLVARSIINPVRQLVDTTRAIRAGDLSRRVDLKAPDELGELAISFDHMTEQLIERNREINALYLAQLEETARRQAILASIGDAVIVQNAAGDIMLTNGAANTLIEQVIQDAALYQQFDALCKQPDELATARMVTFARHHFSVMAMPAGMSSGEAPGYVIVFRDITALVEAEQLKDDIILQLSHELRTPLSAGRGYIDLVLMLEGNNLSDRAKDFTGKAVEQLHILEHMVNDVIDVSSMITGRFRIEPSAQKINLIALIQKWLEAANAGIEQAGLSLTVNFQQEEIWLTGDEKRLSQVFEQVLRNAYSYTLPGGMITVTVQDENHNVVIQVTDSGVGIEPDEIERVFELMYRGRSADAGATDSRGLGLGLYIVRQVIEAHQGIIELSSHPGEGTTVTIKIPKQ